MSVSKLYINDELIDSIKYDVGNAVNQYNWEVPCISAMSSGNGVTSGTIDFAKNDLSGYIHTNIYFSDSLGMWLGATPTKNTTKPNRCYNAEQARPFFTTVTSWYNYYETTNSYFYHPRFDSILVMFFIITLVCIYFPYKIFARAFGRWLKI